MKSSRQYFALTLLLMVMGLYTVAQDGDVYVSMAAGISIPLSDYAKSDFSNESSGFATPGGNFGINFGYRFNEYISLTGLLCGSVNRFDYVELQDWFAEFFPDRRWVVESKSWGLGGLLGGITGSLPLAPNKFFLDGRILGGFTYVYSPAIYVTGVAKGEEDLYVDIEQYSSGSWALDFGAGFRYHRTRHQYFTLYADYFMAHPNYSGVTTDSNHTIERAESFSQKVNAINISLGIGYIVN